MNCLYCGKEISPLRQLRDEDFCSEPHRRLHGDRLRKALSTLAEPEAPPASVAGFAWSLPPNAGRSLPFHAQSFQNINYEPWKPGTWGIRCDSVLGADVDGFASLPQPRAAGECPPADGSPWISAARPVLPASLPGSAFALDASPEIGRGAWLNTAPAARLATPAPACESFARTDLATLPVASVASAAPTTPALCERWTRVPHPAAAAGDRLAPAAAITQMIPARAVEIPTALWPDVSALGALALIAAEETAPLLGLAGAAHLAQPAFNAGPMAAGALETIASIQPQTVVLEIGSAADSLTPAMAGPALMGPPLRTAETILSSAGEMRVEPAVALPQTITAIADALAPGVAENPAQSATAEPASAASLPASAVGAAEADSASVAPRQLGEIAASAGSLSPGGLRSAIILGPAPVEGLSAPLAAAPMLAGLAVASAQIQPIAAPYPDAEQQFARLAAAAAAPAASPVLLSSIELAPFPAELPAPIRPDSALAFDWSGFASLTTTPAATEPGQPAVVESGAPEMQALLPELSMSLASPPVPYAADVSPEAVSGATARSEAAPATTAAAPAMPEFALKLELMPAARLNASIAAPIPGLPSMAPMSRSETLAIAMPASPVDLQAAGLEALLAPVEPLPDARAKRSPGSASTWLSPRTESPAGAVSVDESGTARPGIPPKLEFVGAPPDPVTGSVSAAAGTGVPGSAEMIPVEFYVQRGRPSPYAKEHWHHPRPEVTLPRMTVQAVAPVIDPKSLGVPEEAPTPIRMPRYSRSSVMLWGKGIAAGLALCALLWFGLQGARHSRPTEIAGKMGQDPMALPAAPVAPKGDGFVQSVKRSIVNRAKVEVASDFHSSQQFWNGKQADWGKGWERHRDGYVRPGTIALLRPTIQLTDYRMEFMTQIENKSSSWVVRAHDVDNYYAMKLNVVAPGLRPIVSLVRYPVVNGKRGRRVEVPLPVMMHNSVPQHVALEVRGTRFTAWVGGEQVDTWMDDTIASGGVGFFSEGAERARLYWVKVTNNDDLLGRICAYIAGKRGDGQQAAFAAGHDAEPGRDGRQPALVAALPSRSMRRGQYGGSNGKVG